LRPTRPIFSPGCSVTLVRAAGQLDQRVAGHQQHLVVAGAGGQPGDLGLGEGTLEVAPLVTDLQHQHADLAELLGRVTQDAPHQIHAVGAAGQRQRGLGAVLGRQRRHALAVDVGRVADDQVVGALGRIQQIRLEETDARAELVLVDVDARHRECVAGDVAGIDADLGVGHRGDHRQAAVAGAQVEHALRAIRQPRIQRAFALAVGEQFGDEGARHDHALVDVEGHVLQPGFFRQVGGGLAGGDAFVHQRDGPGFVFGGELVLRTFLQRVQRQAERGEHQPGRLVEGVGGAVAKRNARLFEAGALRGDQFDELRR
jgi:hypothetical protein